MRSLSLTIVAFAASGICCAQLAQTQNLSANQGAALERVVGYLDQVTLHSRYAFDCSLVRVTAHPTPKTELLDEGKYLAPFLSGEESGPLARCVGGVNGTAWYVDIVRHTPKSTHRRSYYDGKWTAFINPSEAKDRVTVVEHYFDPGVGVAPWHLLSVNSGSMLRDLRTAQKLGKVTMESRTPTKASDAGPYQLFSIRFQVPGDKFEHLLHVKLGPELVQVQRIEMLRRGHKILNCEILKHTRIGELYLPTAFRDFSRIFIKDRSKHPEAAIIYDWEIKYEDRHLDPAAFLPGLWPERHIMALAQGTLLPFAWLDGQIKQFVKQSHNPDDTPPRPAAAIATVPVEECQWPNIRAWHDKIIKAGVLKGPDSDYRFNAQAAIVTLAQLNKREMTFAALIAELPGEYLTVKQTCEALQSHKLTYVQVALPESQLASLRDPFLVMTSHGAGKPHAEAGMMIAGECVVWSPAYGRRVISSSQDDVSTTAVVSQNDAKRLQ